MNQYSNILYIIIVIFVVVFAANSLALYLIDRYVEAVTVEATVNETNLEVVPSREQAPQYYVEQPAVDPTEFSNVTNGALEVL